MINCCVFENEVICFGLFVGDVLVCDCFVFDLSFIGILGEFDCEVYCDVVCVFG